MHRYDLHRLSADRQKSRRQFVHADTVRQQFEHLGDYITGVTGLRDNTLLHADIAEFLRSLLYPKNLKQIRRNTPRGHRTDTVAAQIDRYQRKGIGCFGLFSCHCCLVVKD